MRKNSKFKEIFKLAVRNLSRSRRRNVILAIAIGFGFFIVTGIDGLTSGAVGNLEDQITQLAGGTVLISGYEKVPVSESSEKNRLVRIIRDRDYIKRIVEEEHINYEYFSRYTASSGQIVFEGKKILGTVYGRDFRDDKNLIDSFQIIEGNIEDIYKENAIVLNQQMAENLKVEIGESIVYTTSTIFGQNNVTDFTVAAIIKGNNFLSGMMAYADIETINKLVEIPEGGYSTFTIFLKNKKDQAKVATILENRIRKDGIEVSSRIQAMTTNPDNIGRGIDKQFTNNDVLWEGTKYGVVTLNDEIPAIQTVLNVVHIVTTVILIVILLIVMVGISNTYRMVLLERIREIGTMRALGMTGKNTGRVFTTEALILSVLGACAGLVVSIIVMLLLGIPHISHESVSFFLHNGHITFKLSVGNIIVQYLLMIVLTALAVRGSAKKAANMSPAEALRTVK